MVFVPWFAQIFFGTHTTLSNVDHNSFATFDFLPEAWFVFVAHGFKVIAIFNTKLLMKEKVVVIFNVQQSLFNSTLQGNKRFLDVMPFFRVFTNTLKSNVFI